MSLAQISATSVLCQLLEREKPEVNGMTLLGGEYGNAGRDLLRERLLVVGGEPATGTPEQAAEFLRTEFTRWGKVIKDNNIKIE